MSTPHLAPIGRLLRQQRTAAALSQEELAERAGLSVRAVSDLERGVHRVPRLETVRLLANALGLDAADRAELLAAVHPQTVAPSARERARSLPPASLPVPLTPLIGRETEVATIVHRLAHDDIRLLTITGPGGVGKTRVALQVAADLWDVFPDGVWFVDLSPLEDPSLVAAAVGGVLGVREGEVTAARLSIALGAKRLLLVLDNFERVVEAAPLVANMLVRSSSLNVLVTSRIPLHAYGEQEYPLAPLALPDPAHLPPIERMGHYEAVQLFVTRAHAVKPDFTLTNANASAVAEICSRLDGLPLAIELAAARVKVLPPQALLMRLEQRLPLLTGGARTLPARQQTMRDTIAWSHDLLSLEAQIIFRRLAVFPGGCTIEAAEAVAGEGEPFDIFGTVAMLVDESLLRQEEGATGEPRFRMLETVREFELEQLAASGERDTTRARLADWCLALAEQAEPRQPSEFISSAWVPRLNEELPNLRAAVTWLLAHAEAARALRLLVAAAEFWTLRHLGSADLDRWLEAALAGAPDVPARDRATAHYLLSIGHSNFGHDETALYHAQRMLDAAEEAGDPMHVGLAHAALARVWLHRGDVDRAAAAYADVIPLWQAAGGFEVGLLVAQAEVGDIRILQGDLEAGMPLIEDALTRLRQLTDPPWMVVYVINLRGHAALLQGDIRLAAGLFAEAIRNAWNLPFTEALLGALAGMAGVALGHGHGLRAARLLGAVEAARASLGIRSMDTWLYAERITANARATLEPAALKQAWSAGRALPLEAAITEALALVDELTTSADG